MSSILILAVTATTLTVIFSIAFYLHPLAAGVFAGTFVAIAIVVRAIAGDKSDTHLDFDHIDDDQDNGASCSSNPE